MFDVYQTHIRVCVYFTYSVHHLLQIRHRRKPRISGKHRFRAAVRQVIENRPWLDEDIEESGDIGDDVRKNIRLIGQPKKRELLSLQVRVSEYILFNSFTTLLSVSDSLLLFNSLIKVMRLLFSSACCYSVECIS